MRIENALVFRPDGQFHRGSVAFDQVFQDEAGGLVLDAKGMYLIPDMVDIHLHGAKNADVCDGTPEALQTISQFLSSHGVTSCAATMTYGLDKLLPVMETVRDFAQQTGSRCLGVNLEGPFIIPAKKSAQAAKDIVPPNLDLYRQLQAASGNRVRLVALAPEQPDAEDFIRTASWECRISLAHTESNYDTSMAAFSVGADHVTHLFNAMPPLHHRNPGVIGAAMDANAYVEVICDGLHLHPAIIPPSSGCSRRTKSVSSAIPCAAPGSLMVTTSWAVSQWWCETAAVLSTTELWPALPSICTPPSGVPWNSGFHRKKPWPRSPSIPPAPSVRNLSSAPSSLETPPTVCCWTLSSIFRPYSAMVCRSNNLSKNNFTPFPHPPSAPQLLGRFFPKGQNKTLQMVKGGHFEEKPSAL